MKYLFACLCPWLLLSQPPVPRPAPAAKQYQPGELCTLEGVVRHAGTGAPVRKATITVISADPRGGAIQPAISGTNAEGIFSMKGLEPGQYRLMVQKPGFVRTEYGASRTRRQGATLTLEKGQSMKGVEVKLTPHSVITGRITDEDGDPVMGAMVMISKYNFWQGKKQLGPAGQAMTNDLGEYRLFGVAPGRYYLSSQSRNIMGNWGVDRSANREADQDDVATYYPGTNEIQSALQIEVPPSGAVEGMDIRLRRMPTFRIRGQVSGVDAGVNRGGMIALVKKGEPDSFTGFDRHMSNWRGPDGGFELRGVRPGSYLVRALYFEPPTTQLSGTYAVEVTDADVEGIRILLAPGVEVSGVVRLEGEGQLNTADLTVSLESRTNRFMMGGNASARVKDGAFSMPNIGLDHYDVHVRGAPQECYLKSMRLADTDVLEHGLDLKAQISGLEIVLRSGAPQLEGDVADDKGNALSGAAVILRPKSGRIDPLLMKNVTSDQNGHFRITGIVPGEYQLLAFDGVDMAEALDPDLFREHVNRAETVKLEENAKQSRQIKAVKLEER